MTEVDDDDADDEDDDEEDDADVGDGAASTCTASAVTLRIADMPNLSVSRLIGMVSYTGATQCLKASAGSKPVMSPNLHGLGFRVLLFRV